MLGSGGKVVKVILTHDIDYPPQGPGLEHILARRDRFSEEVFRGLLVKDITHILAYQTS